MFNIKKSSIFDSDRKGLSSGRRGLLSYESPFNKTGGLRDIKKIKIDFIDDELDKPIASTGKKDNNPVLAAVTEIENLGTGIGDSQVLNLVPNLQDKNKPDDDLKIVERRELPSTATEWQNESETDRLKSDSESEKENENESESDDETINEKLLRQYKENYESIKVSIQQRLKKEKFNQKSLNTVIKSIEKEYDPKTYQDYKKLTENFKNRLKNDLTIYLNKKLRTNEDNLLETNENIQNAKDTSELSKLTMEKDTFNDEKRLLEEKLEKLKKL